MEDRKIYYFYRYNAWGFDKITILAFTKDQAFKILDDTVKDLNAWLSGTEKLTVINLDRVFEDNND